MTAKFWFSLIPVLCCSVLQVNCKKPHIVMIMCDDLGWNDVSFHGSNQIITENIDALAYNGVILNRHYSMPLCTPTRSAVMTGKYPIRTGMNHFVIVSDEPWGLPLKEKLLPEYLREAGYRTHLIGKWHLGFFQNQYTPTKRGFDTHFGYWGPYIDYWDYTLFMRNRNYSRGYDMRKNMNVYRDNPKIYCTTLFNNEAMNVIKNHDEKDKDHPMFLMINHLAPHAANDDNPLQAPDENINNFPHIPDIERRTLAGMINVLDKGVGLVVKTLKEKKMLDNTIIILLSDNGAPSEGIHYNRGSNAPLRGQKDSPWEGSVRTVGLIYSNLIKFRHRVSNDWFSVTDWLPTLLSAAEIPIPGNIDGIDQWATLSCGRKPKRNEILNNIEQIIGYSSYMKNGWKIVNGTTYNGVYDGYLGKITSEKFLRPQKYIQQVQNSLVGKSTDFYNKISNYYLPILRLQAKVYCNSYQNRPRSACQPLKAPCLFNLITDPCELNNLAENVFYKEKLEEISKDLLIYVTQTMPTQRKLSDPKSDPIFFNEVWSSWQQDFPITV